MTSFLDSVHYRQRQLHIGIVIISRSMALLSSYVLNDRFLTFRNKCIFIPITIVSRIPFHILTMSLPIIINTNDIINVILTYKYCMVAMSPVEQLLYTALRSGIYVTV